MDDLPLEKIAISGPTLASLIQRFTSSPGDIDGLLFGHITHIAASTLSDDSTSNFTAPSSSDSLVATITSFLSPASPLSFYDSSGRLRLTSLPPNHHHLLGWFSARRKTPLRPSMREFSVSASFSSQFQLFIPIKNSQNGDIVNLSPCLFLLFTTPLVEQLIHTHEYRAYQFRTSSESFEPKSIDVVNIGPAFRGHYGSFSPNSPLPMLSCEVRGYSAMNEDSLNQSKQVSTDQRELDMCAEGFTVGALSRLMGSEAANYTAGLEDLYEKMLAKIENLARQVEKSSAQVLEQENHNGKLRYKVSRAGFE